jgi:hypothetical protein
MATVDECPSSMGAMIFAFQGLECELVKIFIHLVEPAELTKLSTNYVSFGSVMKRLLEVSEVKLNKATTKTRLRAMVDYRNLHRRLEWTFEAQSECVPLKRRL